MKCLIMQEGRAGVLEQVDSVTVPDTSTDPETAAWSTWQRTGTRSRGNYAVVRAGKRFSITEKPQRVSTALGAM